MENTSKYKIRFSAPISQVENLIQQFLMANKFKPIPEYGQNHYLFHDPIVTGYRGFIF